METSDGEQEGTIKKMMEEDIGEKGIKGMNPSNISLFGDHQQIGWRMRFEISSLTRITAAQSPGYMVSVSANHRYVQG